MSDYKKSLNLPDTSFPMKANLTQREPEMLRWWEENNIYGTMLEASGSRGSFRLHDGPPYANGHLHLGHALNKILKDITIKSRNIQGQQSVYVPGWDCHGLPIELKVEHELGEKKKEMPPYAVRRRCRQYADKLRSISSARNSSALACSATGIIPTRRCSPNTSPPRLPSWRISWKRATWSAARSPSTGVAPARRPLPRPKWNMPTTSRRPFTSVSR